MSEKNISGTVEVKVSEVSTEKPQKIETPIKKEKKKIEQTEKKRDVAEVNVVPVEKQKRWWKRSYMRKRDEKPEIVRHQSKYGIDAAAEETIKFLQQTYLKTGETIVVVREVVDAIGSFGPAYGDCIRNGAKKEMKRGKEARIKIRKISNKTKQAKQTRAKWEIVLTEYGKQLVAKPELQEITV